MAKKLGVIGGMGPAASAYFYDEIIKHTDAQTDQEHIDMLLLSHASMPDRTKAILTGCHDQLLSAMKADLMLMEAGGISNIAIPCNTSHYFYDQIQAMTSIPIIHMPRESIKYAVSGGNVKKIGILGTDGTVRAGIYKKECDALGVECIVPRAKDQKDIMSLIYDDIKGGKPADTGKFMRPYTELTEAGCDVIILACTELSVYKDQHDVPSNCLDAMDVLVKEAILRSGYHYK